MEVLCWPTPKQIMSAITTLLEWGRQWNLTFLSRFQSHSHSCVWSQRYLVIQREWRAAWQDLESPYQSGQRALDGLHSVLETCNICYTEWTRIFSDILEAYCHATRYDSTSGYSDIRVELWRLLFAIYICLICASLINLQVNIPVFGHFDMADSAAYLIMFPNPFKVTNRLHPWRMLPNEKNLKMSSLESLEVTLFIHNVQAIFQRKFSIQEIFNMTFKQGDASPSCKI
jgi:hypothetical protein